ncbi:MAG: hypothetical protein ACP5RH_01140 [Leptodesmis sp.]|uniref:hypothetical protein n=1 Tax=Leptodesmis sp. TaxID=3100501 RepID=UPI003D117158
MQITVRKVPLEVVEKLDDLKGRRSREAFLRDLIIEFSQKEKESVSERLSRIESLLLEIRDWLSRAESQE